MKPFLLAAAIVLGVLSSAHAFEQFNYPMTIDEIQVIRQRPGRVSLHVVGQAAVKGKAQQVKELVATMSVEGALPDGKTICGAYQCHGILKNGDHGLDVVIQVDADQDGNIEASVVVPFGGEDAASRLQLFQGRQLVASYVQYRVRWWERSDGQRSQDGIQLKLTFTGR
jgi:hypothetical protein